MQYKNANTSDSWPPLHRPGSCVFTSTTQSSIYTSSKHFARLPVHLICLWSLMNPIICQLNQQLTYINYTVTRISADTEGSSLLKTINLECFGSSNLLWICLANLLLCFAPKIYAIQGRS